MRETTHAEAKKLVGKKIRVYQPRGAGGTGAEGYFIGTVQHSPRIALRIIWDPDSAQRWGCTEEGLADAKRRRYWILEEEAKQKHSSSYCPHKTIKQVPLGLGGNCQMITVCCDCKQEVSCEPGSVGSCNQP